MNYNTGYNSYGDSYGDYNQYGVSTTENSNSFPKALPQPPAMQGSQSTYDGFGYDRYFCLNFSTFIKSH